MSALFAARVCGLQADTNSVVAVFLCLVSFSASVYAHGGGLDAAGCHNTERRVTTTVTAGVGARIRCF